MTFDTTFTNGVIAVKEKQLLGEKILRFPELEGAEIVRMLSESGFGGGESDPEKIASYEEGILDAFIRTYAPTAADKAYFLAPNDFHNLKALYKAEKLGQSYETMLAPEGLHTLDELKGMLEDGKDLPEIPEEGTGAEIGAAFDRAEFAYLFRVFRARPVLKKLLMMRVDMTDLLTAFRASSREEAEKLFIGGGKLGKRDFDRIFSENAEVREHALDKSPLHDFYAECLAAAETKLPFTGAERMKETFEARYFFQKRFDLKGKEPFLYYVLRRKAEIANVRMILICRNAGVGEGEIRRRLVGVM